MLKKESKKTSPETQDSLIESNFAFGKLNYSLMLAGVVLLVLGYILMIGGGSKDPNVFSQEIFSFQRMTLAPILIIAGFVVEVFAIMWKVKD